MTQRFLLFIAFMAWLPGFTQIDATDINPFIGTGGHGHTHPSATVPFGMVQLGPDTRKTGWDGCSGYHYTDSTLHGFSHTHLSGTGVSDYSDILFKPIDNLITTDVDDQLPFDKSSEIAEAGYYSVVLENGIQCEFTASERAGVHRYTFPKNIPARFYIDLNYRDEVLDADMKVVGDSLLVGHRYSKSWAKNQKVHFAANSNLPFKFEKGEKPNTWFLDFGLVANAVIFHVALSGCDVEGATKNLTSEAKPFSQTRKNAVELWNKELNKTQVYGGTEDQRTIFATALYHAYSVPNMWSDVDGRYRGMDDIIHHDTLSDHYTIFSLWDTYRTAHPLYAITQPERTEAFISTMLDQFDQSGRLPVWELAANETDCMIGYHSVSVLADALAKGYEIDGERLINAMTATATKPVFGLEIYDENGFLTIQDEAESVSKTLEYSYDDACISWAASHFGMDSVANIYRDRSSGYKSVTDPVSGLVAPRDNGHFLKETNPREVNSHFTEANAWQYSFSPVHDIEGWLNLLGNGDEEAGRVKLEDNLDQLFIQPQETTGRDQADITGLIGQYAHGNEPSHHIAYLYSATHSPQKGQKHLADIISDFYTNTPDGLIGNEDCGQMSAWYVMSTMGLYPLVPGKADYILSTPIWDSVKVVLPSGNSLTIETAGSGIYVEALNVNGSEWDKTWITHDMLLKGGLWHFDKSEKPSDWSLNELYSTDMNSHMIAAPIIQGPRHFAKSAEVTFELPEAGYELVVWDIDGGKMDFMSVGETVVHESQTFYSSFKNIETGEMGQISSIRLTKKPSQWKAKMKEGIPTPQYTARGEDALVDGVKGELDWRKGNWIGVQNQDIVIELTHPYKTDVDDVSIHFLKDIRSWISLPDTLSLFVKKEGEWQLVGNRIIGYKALELDEPALYNVEWGQLNLKRVDMLKVVMRNPGLLPEKHLSAGSESYIFIDEITVVSK